MAMVMAAAAAVAPSSATQISTHHSPISFLQRPNTDHRILLKAPPRCHITAPFKRIAPVRASKPQDQGVNDNAAASKNESTFLSQEDLIYLVKLGGGSVAGAAAIKYGSILFPQITQPNIVQALIMISAPVVVAVFLLIKQSRAGSSN